MISHSRPDISNEDVDSVNEALRTGMIARGRLVREFERRVGEFIDVPFAVATSSGSAALVLALKALGIAPGNEVVMPTYVCRSVFESVLSIGATPILCDIGDDWLISDAAAASVVSAATAAVIVPYVFGIAKDIRPIRDLGVPIIEDCCQSFGATTPEGRTGSLGAVSIFSFHATKCLTTGEGGMCCSTDADLSRRILQIRDGQAGRLAATFPTGLSDLQAALGLSQLRRYASFLERRRSIANSYYEEVVSNCFATPLHIADQSIHFRFPLKTCLNVEHLIRDFASHGISVRRGVDQLLHRCLDLTDENFPVATRLFETTLSIPIYPALSESDRRWIVARIREVVR